jgi:N-acetylglutamate synthase-like GNAT family acetyltransferase
MCRTHVSPCSPKRDANALIAERKGALPSADFLASVAIDLSHNVGSIPGVTMFDVNTLTIREYSEALAPDFYRINAQWIEAMFTMEETDRETLEHPNEKIIRPGGAILFVETSDQGVVGAGALQKTGPGRFELTKMGVLDSVRGRKAGEFLLVHLVHRARTLNAEQLYLLTNKKCAAAIHLYEKIGFVHDAQIMEDYGKRYARCDVAMSFPIQV